LLTVFSLFISNQKCNFEAEQNKWNHVEDFNWLKQQQSPHWGVIEEKDRITLSTDN
jgi:hypothetical protein